MDSDNKKKWRKWFPHKHPEPLPADKISNTVIQQLEKNEFPYLSRLCHFFLFVFLVGLLYFIVLKISFYLASHNSDAMLYALGLT